MQHWFGIGSLWLFVFSSLGLFFVLAERRFRGRGFGILAAMLVVVGIWSVMDPSAALTVPNLGSLVIGRSLMVLGLIASALNTHFLCIYFGSPWRSKIVRTSYGLVGLSFLVLAVITLVQSRNLALLRFPEEYRSPSDGFTAYIIVALAVHSLANLIILLPPSRAQRSPARGMLATLAVASPLVLAEGYLSIAHAQRWSLIEASTWVYTLIVVSNLISEFQGTEGLLRQTTSSLEARTAELESSYAEINLMASELSRKQQLAAVGELAAAIAHEVRNPLAIIMNAVSAMKRTTLSAMDKDTLLHIVNEETERLNQLVAELLRFARPVTAARSPISLYDICERATQAAPEGYVLRVETGVDDQLGPVLVDPGLFRVVLDNLIANACQAMPDGGTIELAVRQGAFSDGTPAATVQVKDTGVGMVATELEQAKKPFFTTKPRGTGLGIPIAEKIVEAHGGEMELVSVQGTGTTVNILLPLERELRRAGTYSDGLKTANRRRLRSIPPVLVGGEEAPSADAPRRPHDIEKEGR